MTKTQRAHDPITPGEILLTEGTSDIARVKALVARRPALGAIFGLGLIALLGFPPFSLFVSELNMLRAQVQVGLGWVAAISLVCMAVIFAAVMSHARHLLLGPRDGDEPVHKTPAIVTVPLIGGLAVCAAIGVFAWPLDSLLQAAARVVAL